MAATVDHASRLPIVTRRRLLGTVGDPETRTGVDRLETTFVGPLLRVNGICLVHPKIPVIPDVRVWTGTVNVIAIQEGERKARMRGRMNAEKNLVRRSHLGVMALRTRTESEREIKAEIRGAEVIDGIAMVQNDLLTCGIRLTRRSLHLNPNLPVEKSTRRQESCLSPLLHRPHPLVLEQWLLPLLRRLVVAAR